MPPIAIIIIYNAILDIRQVGIIRVAVDIAVVFEVYPLGLDIGIRIFHEGHEEKQKRLPLDEEQKPLKNCCYRLRRSSKPPKARNATVTGSGTISTLM